MEFIFIRQPSFAEPGREFTTHLHIDDRNEMGDGFRVAVFLRWWHLAGPNHLEVRYSMLVLPNGVRHMPAYLSRSIQEALVEAVRGIVQKAPLFVPAMPRTGKEMSVRMTNCGPLGWVTDKERGYRYQPTHPLTGEPWPPIPESLLDLWRQVSGYPNPPQACLINFYTADAKMGLHQDRDEADFSAPVVSVSLGDDCLFRVGQATREGATKSFRLKSGDVVMLGGDGRLAFHGVDRIYPSTSALLKNGGRINLTLRRVTKPDEISV